MKIAQRIIEWSIPQALLGAFVFGVIGSEDKDLAFMFLSGVMIGVAFMSLAVMVIFRIQSRPQLEQPDSATARERLAG